MTSRRNSSPLIFSDGRRRVYAAPLPSGTPAAAVVERLLAADSAVPPGAVVGHTADGAPFLCGVPGVLPEISISHSRTLVAVAVAPPGCAAGVDAETVGRDRQLRRVAGRFLSATQLPRWGASAAGLLRAWTIKEALYKAALTPGLALADIPLPEDASGVVSLGGRRFATLELSSPWPDNVISLAYLADFSFND